MRLDFLLNFPTQGKLTTGILALYDIFIQYLQGMADEPAGLTPSCINNLEKIK